VKKKNTALVYLKKERKVVRKNAQKGKEASNVQCSCVLVQKADSGIEPTTAEKGGRTNKDKRRY